MWDASQPAVRLKVNPNLRRGSRMSPRQEPTMSRSAAPLALLLLTVACEKEPKPATPPPPPEVNVAKPLQQDVPIYIEMIGETRGNTEIEIRARVEGFIETIEFEQGKLVKKDDL